MNKILSNLAKNKQDVFFITTTLALYLGICSQLIGRASIWFDEAFGAYLIRFSFADLTYFTGKDVHPPFYYYLLKLWSMIFGNSDVALRGMSLFFGVIAIVFAFLLIKKWFGRMPAYVSTLLMVISPMIIRYSIEMRMYTLVFALVLAATYVLTKAMKTNKPKWWTVYALLIAAGMWTHYLIATAWITHWVWRASRIGLKTNVQRKAFFSKQWLLTHVLAVALFVPWLPWLINRVGDVQSNGFWIPPVTPITILDYVTNLFMYQDASKIGVVLTLLLLVLGVLFIMITRSPDAKEKPYFKLVAYMALVPPLILVILSLPPLKPFFIDRYILFAVFFSTILMAVILARAKNTRLSMVAGAIIVVFSIVGIGNVQQYGNYNKFTQQTLETKELIAQIRSVDHKGTPIVADTPWVYYEAAQYSSNESKVYFIDKYVEYKYGALEMLRKTDIGKIKDLDGFLTDHREVWYIGRPGDAKMNPPAGDMTKVRSIYLKDRITGKPAYEASLYRLNAE